MDREIDEATTEIRSGLPPRIKYAELTSKQKEIYNFQKVASLLAEHGFNCIKLADDWQGADFLAYHKDGDTTLKVQLKGRVTISKVYQYKGLHMAFPVQGQWYIVDHDILIDLIGEHTPWLASQSWVAAGGYSSQNPNASLVAALAPYRLGPPS